MLITSSFPPVTGGAETYAVDVACGLAARGHEVTIATDVPHGHRPGDAFADPAGVTVRRLSEYRALIDDPSKIRWEQMAYGLMGELARCASASRPELVMTNSLDTAPLGKTVALELDVPWVATFHEHAPEDEPLARGRLRFVYEALGPSLVLAGSGFYADRARHWGAGAVTTLIHHGIDTDAFHPDVGGAAMRARYGYEPHDLVVACAGRLKPRKGIRELVEAFSRVREGHPHARLLIVGSVSSASLDYASALEADVDRLDLRDAVTIDRTVTFDQMPAVLAAADVVAQPSWEEGLGLSVLEAMSSGRATVTTDVVGIREILSAPDIALVVPPGDPPALADALLSLVGAPGLRRRLGERARHHVERHFSRQRMLAATEAALQRAVGTHSRLESADA